MTLNNTRARTLGYWSTTGLLAFVLLSGGVASLLQLDQNVEGMARLGYPAYMLLILGFWKVLGGLALLAPRLPRLKEWVYAGAIFDLTGAAASYALCCHDPAQIFWPALFAVCAMASWALRPPSRTLGVLLSSESRV